jgi:UDP-3-O-acyl-N-acetylglucosamine deacetylase
MTSAKHAGRWPRERAGFLPEAAHHNLLDMMGDLRCLGVPVNGRFIGFARDIG